MHSISAREIDLLCFFETEPQMLEPNIPWPYNESFYELARGNLTLSFSVAPAYRDVKLTLRIERQVIYELHAAQVDDVRCFRERGKEMLLIVLSSTDSLELGSNLPSTSIIEEMVDSARRTGSPLKGAQGPSAPSYPLPPIVALHPEF